MTLFDFKKTVQIKTQDSQSKLPTAFGDWKLIIEEGINRLDREVNLIINSTEVNIRTTNLLENDTSNIPLVADLIMALAYYIAQMYVTDVTMKQKYILDYEDEKGIFIWNKFKEMELSK